MKIRADFFKMRQSLIQNLALAVFTVSLSGLSLSAQAQNNFSEFPPPEAYKPIKFFILEDSLATYQVEEFLRALEQEKQNLMNLYELDNSTYNELAHIAVGILGNESKFFQSPRYILKANLPDPLVYFVKQMRNSIAGIEQTTSLSKGPTLMKAVPERIAERYHITDKEQLEVPFNAAVATLGYLADAYYELLSKIETYNMTCVTDENFSEMLLYLYFGGSSYRRDLINCDVTPERNIYIRNHRENREKFLLFERSSF